MFVDTAQANKTIKQVRYVVPTLNEIRYDLNGKKYFQNLI